MTSTEITLVIIVAAGLVSLWIFFRQKANKRIQEVQKEIDGQSILYTDRSANFFGQVSRGYKQIRGNGILFITSEQILFNMWFPDKKLFIPVSSIISFKSPKSFLGKTKLSRLVQIDFYNESGYPDAAAWLTCDLESCLKVLDLLRSGQEKTNDQN